MQHDGNSSGHEVDIDGNKWRLMEIDGICWNDIVDIG